MTSAFSFSPADARAPADLSPWQRGLLVMVVVLLHVGAAMLAMRAVRESRIERDAPAIEVALIEAPSPLSAAKAPETTPQPPRKAEPPPAQPAPAPTPAPPRPVTVAQPQAVASTKPAQANEPAAAPPVAEARQPVQQSSAVPASAAMAGPGPAMNEAPRAPAAPKVLPSSAVAYEVQPVKNYPRASIELGEEGVVVLSVLFDEQGRPKHIDVAKKSGFPRLDQQAVRDMNTARIKPYLENGVPREVVVQAPVRYSLEEQ